jgi:hypothetical protein
MADLSKLQKEDEKMEQLMTGQIIPPDVPPEIPPPTFPEQISEGRPERPSPQPDERKGNDDPKAHIRQVSPLLAKNQSEDGQT